MGVFDLFKQDNPDNNSLPGFDRIYCDFLSSDPGTWMTAAASLRTMGKPALIPLVEKLRGADDPCRIRILSVIQGLSGVSPSEICASLKTTGRMEKADIIPLFALPGKNAIPYLLKLTTDADEGVRSVASGALAQIGEPAIPVLTRALSHRSHRIRLGAADALTRMRWVPKTQDDYFHFLIAQEHWSDLVRAKKAAVPYLIEILSDRYYAIRMAAAKALGATGDPRAIQALGNLLADPENEVCISAIEALKGAHHTTAIPHLVAALSHQSYNVRHMAATALTAYGWSPDSPDERARYYLASEQWHELTRMGSPIIPFLIELLRNPRSSIRAGVATALRGMGKPGRDALASALHHEDPVIQKAAADLINEEKAIVLKRTAIPEKEPEAPVPPSKDTMSRPHVLPDAKEVKRGPPTDQRVATAGIHKPKAADRSHRSVETPHQETASVLPHAVPEIRKSREFEQPSPATPDSLPHDRQPDFSGLAQEPLETENLDEGIASLIASLSDEDESIRTLAVDALGRIGLPAIESLAMALRDQSCGVRLAAAEILGRIGNERAVDPLIGALQDSDDEVRAAAARSLGEIGEFPAFVPLIRALEDNEPAVRESAEAALAMFGERAAGPVKKLFSHENALVRGSAAAILGKIAGGDSMADLESLFSDPDESVKERAAIALGKLGLQAIPRLAEISRDRDPAMRICAVIGLGHAGPESREYLIAATRDNDPRVRARAQAFLDAIAHPDTGSEILYTAGTGASREFSPVIHGIPEEVSHPLERGEAVESASLSRGVNTDQNGDVKTSSAGGSAEINVLIDALSSPEPDMRIRAAQALGKMGEHRAIASLLERLGDPDGRVKLASAEALGLIAGSEAIPGLTRLLEDSDEEVRLSAAQALGAIGQEAAVPGLVGALADDDYHVRAEVCDTLIRIGTAGIPHLKSAISHPSRKIRKGAALCLSQLGWDPDNEQDLIHYLIAHEAWIDLSEQGEAVLDSLNRFVLTSAEEDLRMGAVLTLVKMDNPRAIGMLIQALTDKSLLIRRKAMNALVDRGESAREPLIEAASSGDPDIRAVSAQVLERIGRKSSA